MMNVAMVGRDKTGSSSEAKLSSPTRPGAVAAAYSPAREYHDSVESGDYCRAVRHRLICEVELAQSTAAEEERRAAQSEAELLAKRVADLEAERVAAMAALKAEAEAREIMERKLRESELELSLMESVLEGMLCFLGAA